MDYLLIFSVVFMAIGLRGFQQKVVNANRYKLMVFVSMLIYTMEGTAILTIAKGGPGHIVAGALGAGLGMLTFVSIYNRFFIRPLK